MICTPACGRLSPRELQTQRTCEAGWGAGGGGSGGWGLAAKFPGVQGRRETRGIPGRMTQHWKHGVCLHTMTFQEERACPPAPGPRLTGVLRPCPGPWEPAEPSCLLTRGLLWRPNAGAPSKHLSHRQTGEKDEEAGLLLPEPTRTQGARGSRACCFCVRPQLGGPPGLWAGGPRKRGEGAPFGEA